MARVLAALPPDLRDILAQASPLRFPSKPAQSAIPPSPALPAAASALRQRHDPSRPQAALAMQAEASDEGGGGGGEEGGWDDDLGEEFWAEADYCG